MDIHNIATGKGDCTLVVMPDGTTMLIDAGDTSKSRFKCDAYPDDSRTPGQWIARYIKHFTGSGKVDYFMLTHFHSDHFGCIQAMRPGPVYGLCGIMDVAEEIRIGKIVDRGYPDYDFPSYEWNCKGNPSFPDYVKFVRWQCANNGVKGEKFVVGSHKQFALLNNPKPYKKVFDVFNVASASEITAGKGMKTRKLYSEDSDPLKFDENMNSNVILMTYGRFKYYNGGDLGGFNNRYAVKERDWESPVADIVGPVTVMKADHHAWQDVLNPYFLWVTRPDAIIAQCSHINHPWKQTVERIMDPQMPGKNALYCTTDSGRSQVGEELFDRSVKGIGHIVVRVYEGGKSYQIFILDNRSTDYHVIDKTPVIDLH